MTLRSDQRRTLKLLIRAVPDDLRSLAAAAGLDPAKDFRHSDWQGVDFGNDDITGFDFSGANLTRANLSQARGVGRAIFKGAKIDETRWPSKEQNQKAITHFMEKTKLLCNLVRVSLDTFLSELSRNHGVSIRTIKHWFKEKTPVIRRQNCAKIIRYWNEYRGVELTEELLLGPIEEFDLFIKQKSLRFDGSGVLKNENALVEAFHPYLIGTYQVIRPNSSRGDSYILEAMEISTINNDLMVSMYSHNAPSGGQIYKGRLQRTAQSYFALLSKTHERDAEAGSIRSLAFQVGSASSKHAISGIIVRSGANIGSGSQLTASPFFCIRSDERDGFQGANFKTLGTNRIYRLHTRGHVILGALNNKDHPRIYEFCIRLINQLEMQQENLGYDRNNVIRALDPKKIGPREGVGFEEWRNTLKKTFDI